MRYYCFLKLTRALNKNVMVYNNNNDCYNNGLRVVYSISHVETPKVKPIRSPKYNKCVICHENPLEA